MQLELLLGSVDILSNVSKIGSFKNGLYAVHDSFTTLVSSQNHFVHLPNLSDKGFVDSKCEDWVEQLKAVRSSDRCFP